MDKLFKAFAQMIAERLDPLKVEIEGIEKVVIQGKQGEPGKDGHTPTDTELLRIIRPLIPKVKDGHTPTDTELLRIIRPLIPKVKDGETPSDERLKALIQPLIAPMIPEPIPGKDGSPDTGEDIVKKINKDESGKKIKAAHLDLKEFDERLKTAEANAKGGGGFGGGHGSFVYDFDYSSLLDGSTKTFALPANAHILLLLGSSDQGFFRKGVDYTYTASTFTFTSAIDETTVLSQGQTLTLIYKLV